MSEQAVANETDGSENQSTEESGAQDELDSLLSEYEQETSETGGQQQQEDSNENNQGYMSPDVQRILERETQNDIKDASNAIKEESGLTLPDSVFKGVLHASVEGDPRAMRLWANRHNDQKGWNAYLSKVAKNLADEMKSLPDQGATSDREAVEAAVRNASTHQPSAQDEPDVASMSDVDFAQYKMKLARGAKKG